MKKLREVYYDQTNGGLSYKQTNGQLEDIQNFKSYTATLTQAGTAAPTATPVNAGEAEYLGAIVWTRSAVGTYVGTLAGAFTADKTIIVVTPSDPLKPASAVRTDANTVTLKTAAETTGTLALADGCLSGASVEIRVYA